jgi:hypothetical protein
MTTPAELKVIEAAITWRDDRMPARLIEAVDALLAEREAGPELTITWGGVVESDHIWSGVTKKWYKVISAVLVGDRMRIQAKGLPKSITPRASADVRVRRGATGRTMDMWNVVWSAQTIPNVPTDPDKPESEES